MKKALQLLRRKEQPAEAEVPAPGEDQNQMPLNVSWSSHARADGSPSYEAAGPFKVVVDAAMHYIASTLPYLAIQKIEWAQTDGMFGSKTYTLRVTYYEEAVPYDQARKELVPIIGAMMQQHNIASVEINPEQKLLDRFRSVWDGTLEPEVE